MDEAYESPAKLNKLPLMFVYGGNDQIIPKGPTEQVLAKLGPNATVKRYPNGYHTAAARPRRRRTLGGHFAVGRGPGEKSPQSTDGHGRRMTPC
jgi:alpha-beta hydrolase superfamily lysophospholipase